MCVCDVTSASYRCKIQPWFCDTALRRMEMIAKSRLRCSNWCVHDWMNSTTSSAHMSPKGTFHNLKHHACALLHVFMCCEAQRGKGRAAHTSPVSVCRLQLQLTVRWWGEQEETGGGVNCETIQKCLWNHSLRVNRPVKGLNCSFSSLVFFFF